MKILCLCRQSDLGYKEPEGYAGAFERLGVRLVLLDEDFPVNGDIHLALRKCGGTPDLILHPEIPFHVLPAGLTAVDVPTACFQFDTYAYTRRRLRWSMLFDYPVVFHPGFENQFREAGHPGAITLFHAVDPKLFEGPEEDRILDVGWVGTIDGVFYKARRRILPVLAAEFRMNDWTRRHSPGEMAHVYKKSKVVVNIGRDDYPQDANLRVFEAMAAGALLITRAPTELTEIGFEEGKHFVAYREDPELPRLIRHCLDDLGARLRIAAAAKRKVLEEHTYDRRVGFLLGRLAENGGRKLAPARQWPKEAVSLAYLDYYAAHRALPCAWTEFMRIAPKSFRSAPAGASLLARAYARRIVSVASTFRHVVGVAGRSS